MPTERYSGEGFGALMGTKADPRLRIFIGPVICLLVGLGFMLLAAYGSQVHSQDFESGAVTIGWGWGWITFLSVVGTTLLAIGGIAIGVPWALWAHRRLTNSSVATTDGRLSEPGTDGT
jgi:TRAP-type C4-dicarboxylate transport system permease small subunit